MPSFDCRPDGAYLDATGTPSGPTRAVVTPTGSKWDVSILQQDSEVPLARYEVVRRRGGFCVDDVLAS